MNEYVRLWMTVTLTENKTDSVKVWKIYADLDLA